MKILRVIFLTGAVCTAAVRSPADLANAIQAIVHDTVVTRTDVETRILDVRQELFRQYRNQPAVFEVKLAEAMNEALEQQIETQLILHEFSAAGYSIPESIIEDEVQSVIRNRFGDRITLTKSLHQRGENFEKFRRRIREEFIVSQMRLKNISGEIIISPHKIEKYYLEHQNDFKIEEQVRLRMIVLNKSSPDSDSARSLATEIAGKIKDGVAFADMARIHSQGANAREGGLWGWAERSKLRAELADVAFALEPGQVSDVIETPEACFVMLVEEKRSAHVKALSEVRDEIESAMLREERDRLQKEWIERLKKKTFVRYF